MDTVSKKVKVIWLQRNEQIGALQLYEEEQNDFLGAQISPDATSLA